MQTTGGAGAHYWLASNNVYGDETYFSADNGHTWMRSSIAWGQALNQFMIISGPYISFSRESWASIKTLFLTCFRFNGRNSLLFSNVRRAHSVLPFIIAGRQLLLQKASAVKRAQF